MVEGFPATVEQAQEFSKMAICDLFLCLNQSDDYINDLPYLKGEVNEAVEFSEEQFKRRLDLYNEN